jgi:hypothetical protein
VTKSFSGKAKNGISQKVSWKSRFSVRTHRHSEAFSPHSLCERAYKVVCILTIRLKSKNCQIQGSWHKLGLLHPFHGSWAPKIKRTVFGSKGQGDLRYCFGGGGLKNTVLKTKRDIQPSTSERQIWKHLTNPLYGVQTVLKIWKWLDYSRNALSLFRLNFHNSKSLKRILNQQKQLYALLYLIYLRTILYHYHNFLIRHTFQLEFHMHVAPLSCLSHATADDANLQIPAVLQSSSLCPRHIPHFSFSLTIFFWHAFGGGGILSSKHPRKIRIKLIFTYLNQFFWYKTETWKILNEMTAGI